ncbi:hypothetical protein C9374_011288 [Naegleria lovaniensis]|uniref:Cytochrome P450 n=1 Tax=Naegleria lovaniensis TaxID=51637 RepID=A0AA88H0K8_NAELO|nr:uncharacterized protein C9374_011288 [Naegleria lovaniensis]KAG2392563.1 hypothetical protein C9374_011288 [Naegleria lovaniensis]
MNQSLLSSTPSFAADTFSMITTAALWGALLTCALIALYILKLFYQIYRNYSLVKHIPGSWQVAFAPIHIPLISPICNFSNVRGVLNCAKKIGDSENGIFRMSMASQNIVWLMGSDYIKQATVSWGHNIGKPQHYEIFDIFGENIVSAKNTESWKKHHRACSPAFSTRNLEYVVQVANDTAQMLLERWFRRMNLGSDATRLAASSTSTMEINATASTTTPSKTNNRDHNKLVGGEYQLPPHSVLFDGNEMAEVTMNVLLNAGYGLSKTALFADSERKKHLLTAEEKAQGEEFLHHMESPFNIEKGLKAAGEVLDQIIAERKKEFGVTMSSFNTNEEREQFFDSEDEKKDLLSLLVKANLRDQLLTDMEMKSNAFVVLLAGYETTSSTLQWLVYELAKNPDVQKKCQDEIDRLLNHGTIPFSYEMYNDFQYLNAVIMETLRLHCPTFQVDKIVLNKNTRIGKYDIPKGTHVNIHIMGLNLNENYWENANKFDPERFATKELKEQAQNQATWIPFSFGNRRCIGFKFAQLEIISVVIQLLKECNFVLLNDETVDPVFEQMGLTLKPGNLKVAITSRRRQQQ